MADESKLKQVLGHLAWLNMQAGFDINRDHGREIALFTWAAAARLQFHFVMPESDADQIAELAGRKRAAKLIDDFVWATKAAFDAAEAAKTARPIHREGLRRGLSALRRRISAILDELPPLFGLEAPQPVRWQELESKPDWAKLLRDWAAITRKKLKRAGISSDRGPIRASLGHGPMAGLRGAVDWVLVAQDEKLMNKSSAGFRRAVRETTAGLLEFEADEATERASGKTRRRWLDLARRIGQDLRAAGGRKG